MLLADTSAPLTRYQQAAKTQDALEFSPGEFLPLRPAEAQSTYVYGPLCTGERGQIPRCVKGALHIGGSTLSALAGVDKKTRAAIRATSSLWEGMNMANAWAETDAPKGCHPSTFIAMDSCACVTNRLRQCLPHLSQITITYPLEWTGLFSLFEDAVRWRPIDPSLDVLLVRCTAAPEPPRSLLFADAQQWPVRVLYYPHIRICRVQQAPFFITSSHLTTLQLIYEHEEVYIGLIKLIDALSTCEDVLEHLALRLPYLIIHSRPNEGERTVVFRRLRHLDLHLDNASLKEFMCHSCLMPQLDVHLQFTAAYRKPIRSEENPGLT